MDERLLLSISIFLGLTGVIALFFLPELPRDEIQGEITWSNGTHAWFVKHEQYWVEFEEPIEKTGKVTITGRINANYVSKARSK